MTGDAALDSSKVGTIEKAVFGAFWALFSSKSSFCKAEKEPRRSVSLSLSPHLSLPPLLYCWESGFGCDAHRQALITGQHTSP